MTFTYKNLEITKFPQSGFLLVTEGKYIYLDPFRLPDNCPKADYILLTHEHPDHADPDSLNKIITSDTKIILNTKTQEVLADKIGECAIYIMDPNQHKDLEDFKLQTINAYCIDKYRDSETKTLYHPKENNGLGFILNFNDIYLYHAGDTDNIPELKNLENKINIAMFPISGTYVATPQEAFEAISIIKPEIVIPIHYDAGKVGGIQSLEEFKNLMKSSKTQITDLSCFE